MASFNRVILLGNVTRDPELKHLPSGMTVTDIGLAVNDRRKGPNGDWIDETTFVDVTLWGRTAEIAAQYLTKGSPTLIEGRLKLDSWEKDGQKHSRMRVVGEKLQLLGSRQGGGGEGSGYSQRSQQSNYSQQRQAPQQQAPSSDPYYDMGGGDDVPF